MVFDQAFQMFRFPQSKSHFACLKIIINLLHIWNVCTLKLLLPNVYICKHFFHLKFKNIDKICALCKHVFRICKHWFSNLIFKKKTVYRCTYFGWYLNFSSSENYSQNVNTCTCFLNVNIFQRSKFQNWKNWLQVGDCKHCKDFSSRFQFWQNVYTCEHFFTRVNIFGYRKSFKTRFSDVYISWKVFTFVKIFEKCKHFFRPKIIS